MFAETYKKTNPKMTKKKNPTILQKELHLPVGKVPKPRFMIIFKIPVIFSEKNLFINDYSSSFTG